MQETSFSTSTEGNVWTQLTSMEKTLALIYRKKLLGGEKINSTLVQEMNMIHGKYPEFDVSCIPVKYPILIQNFNDLQEDDKAVLVSYFEHIKKGMNEGRYMGLAILARRILEQYPSVDMKQVEDFLDRESSEIRIVMDQETIVYD